MQAIQTEVMVRGPARFDMVGQRLPSSLHTVDEGISAGLAKRLVGYATRAMAESGFGAVAQDWAISVYTMDGDEKPADRFYCVRWTNPKGGYIEVVGILTSHGWPSLDHGFEIGQD